MMKVRDLGTFIRDRRRDVGLSVRTLARLAGVSNPYLSQIERGLRKPSAEIINGIAKALRISAETLYVQAGILDERKRRPADVVGAISEDDGLTTRQKEALIQIYRSFRDETQRRRERRKSATPPPPAASRSRPGGRVETAG